MGENWGFVNGNGWIRSKTLILPIPFLPNLPCISKEKKKGPGAQGLVETGEPRPEGWES